MSARDCTTCGLGVIFCKCPDGPKTGSDGDRLACPWCAHMLRGLWDLGDDGGEEDDMETECGGCGQPLLVSRHVSVSYTARRP